MWLVYTSHGPFSLVKVNLVELELVLKPSPFISAKHGHVLAVVSVRPVFARISWLFQDELRHWIFTKVSPLRPQRTMTGSGRRGCCRFEPSPHLPWTKLEAHTAKLHFGVHLALHHLGFVVLKLFCRVALRGALSNGPKQPTSRGSRRRACPTDLLRIHLEDPRAKPQSLECSADAPKIGDHLQRTHASPRFLPGLSAFLFVYSAAACFQSSASSPPPALGPTSS